MFRKAITSFAAAFAISVVSGFCQPFDSSAVNLMIDRYVAAIGKESPAVKTGECDFILNECRDKGLRDYAAVRLYGHYVSSKLMGDEEVAIYLADNWFIPGKASFGNDVELLNARIFADFNRSSLIGRKAPSLRLQTPDGSFVEALGTAPDSSGLADGHHTLRILYFYDTGCAKCKIETPLLRKMLEDRGDAGVTLVAVYTGQDEQAWAEYRRHLEIDGGTIVRHYYDPELASDFQRKYGVLQTPKMFLIGRDGRILGRGLDTEALAVLLDFNRPSPGLEYGNQESWELYDKLLDGLQARDIEEIADHIERQTLQERKDTVQFRQLTGDLLYYLTLAPTEAYVDAAGYLIKEKIRGHADIWSSKDDSLKIIGLAGMVEELYGRIPVGSRLPDIKVPGTCGGKKKMWNLRKMKDITVIFHSPMCSTCRDNIAAAEEMGLKFLAIDMDEIDSRYPELAGKLKDTFDLSAFPFILQTDRKGRVTRRYIDLTGEKLRR